MDELIKAHQQAKEKQAKASSELKDLQKHEEELKGKIREAALHLASAEQQLSKALTSESLERARAVVEEARKREGDIKTLLKNIERAINDIKGEQPALQHDVMASEMSVWAAQKNQLLGEIKGSPDTLRLILKAYAAAWKTGYRWELEVFIRKEIMGADFSIDPESMEPLWVEMSREIWPNAPTPEPA